MGWNKGNRIGLPTKKQFLIKTLELDDRKTPRRNRMCFLLVSVGEHEVILWKSERLSCQHRVLPRHQATDHQVEFGCFTATICQQSFMVRIDRDKWWSTSSIAKSGLLQSIPGLTLSPGIRVSTQLICLLALPADQRRLDDSSRLLASILQMLFLIPTQWQRHNTWYLLIGGPTG